MRSLITRATGLTPPAELIAAGRRPGLLVSVRDADEALLAFEGGADVIDVKEPASGPLGAASAETVQSVVEAIDGRRPVTIALGELADQAAGETIPRGVAVAKVGLAGSVGTDWRRDLALCGKHIIGWRGRAAKRKPPSAGYPLGDSGGFPDGSAPATLCSLSDCLAPAAYLDHQQAGSPAPDEILGAAIEMGCPWLVLDTWDKSGRSSLDLWSQQWLARLIQNARDAGVRVVLAGGLRSESLGAVAACSPDLIGVRGAACVGGRAGRIDPDRVRSLAQELARLRRNRE